MPELETRAPLDVSRKVAAGGIASLLAVLTIAVVNHFFPGVGDQLSGEIEATVVMIAGTAAAYLARERA